MYVRERITELNKQWNIRPTPNGVCGVQQSLKGTFHVRTVHLHQLAPPNATFWHTKAVNVISFLEMEQILDIDCM